MLLVYGILASMKDKRKYKKQTVRRRQIIMKLRGEGRDWEHIALVLGVGGFKDESGEEFEARHVEAEYDATKALDLDVLDELG